MSDVIWVAGVAIGVIVVLVGFVKIVDYLINRRGK